ncbi:MAG: hypothetical protein KGS46_06680 [Chloroflexi bacterium]|nr:hypothetical protein [Chloroflexota bacterium]
MGCAVQQTPVTPLAAAPTLTPTPITPRCPQATPEIFRVEPLQSPTQALEQVVQVRIGLGEQVTVETVTGIFTATGSFNAFSRPAQVTITLQPDTVHKLKVTAKVSEVTQGGCKYGGYTLGTERDQNGLPLVIEQRSVATVPLNLLATSSQTILTPTITAVLAPTIVSFSAIIATPQVPPTSTIAMPTRVAATLPVSATSAPPVPASATTTPRPILLPTVACAKVAYNDLIVSSARPAALASSSAGACVMVVYKDGEETRHSWYPVGARLRLGYVMYVRLPTNQVTIFTKDNVHMAREFVKGRKAEDLPLKREGNRLLLNASGTAIFTDLGAGEHMALVDVLVRQ